MNFEAVPKIEAHLLCPHSWKARPFLTQHICWKDRIGKERNAVYPGQEREQLENNQVASPSGREYYPIGGSNKYNNHSGEFAKTWGPRSLKPTGNISRPIAISHSGSANSPQGALRKTASLPTIQSLERSRKCQDHVGLGALMRQHTKTLVKQQRQGTCHHTWQDGYMQQRSP